MRTNQYDLFQPDQPKKEEKPKKPTASMDEVREVFDHWNKMNIIVHRKLNDDMVKAIRKALSSYEKEEVMNAISYYEATLHSDASFWSHVWPIHLFLSQKNAMPRFLTIEQCRAMFRGPVPEILMPPIPKRLKPEEIF